MPIVARRLLAVGLLVAAGPVLRGSAAPVQESDNADTEGVVSFSAQIQPIFEARCTECHSGPNAEWGLDLTSYENAMKGSDYGAVIDPGDPDGSVIIEMIASGEMPEEGEPVTAPELALIETWIGQGAEDN